MTGLIATTVFERGASDDDAGGIVGKDPEPGIKEIAVFGADVGWHALIIIAGSAWWTQNGYHRHFLHQMAVGHS